MMRGELGRFMGELQLVGAALAGIALLLYLILGAKLHAFVALLIGSLVVGVGAGMPLGGVLESMTAGLGSTLASIAALVGLGAMFGRMLEVSGGAETLAESLTARLGARNAQWAMLIVGILVATPVFFDVAFILLVSVLYGLTKKTGKPLVFYALPLLAGLAVAHAFIPPTPGPLAVAGLLGADLGLVMVAGFSIGVPAAVLAGPVYARFIAPHVPAGVPANSMTATLATAPQREALPPNGARPSVALIVGLIAVPLLLIVGNTVATAVLAEDDPVRRIAAGVGHPLVALTVTTLLSFRLLGTRAGYSRAQVQELAARALEPTGMILLVTGAGGMLKQVLIDSGVGATLADGLAGARMPPVLMAFAIAAGMRLMQGSATVAMLTAAGLIAALLDDVEYSQPMLALLTIAIAAGATIASHVNDSGFWLVNRYLGLSVADTLKTWTATTTIVALVSLVLALAAAALIG